MLCSTAHYEKTEGFSPWLRHMPYWVKHWDLEDLLHMIWLGFGKDVIGQLLYDLAKQISPILNDGLHVLWHRFKLYCRMKRIVCYTRAWNALFLTMEANIDYPTITTRMKGIKTKMLFFFVVEETEKIYDSGLDDSLYSELKVFEKEK
jgi:hypothetical protein